jgi:hypothetical protein
MCASNSRNNRPSGYLSAYLKVSQFKTEICKTVIQNHTKVDKKTSFLLHANFVLNLQQV